ncbi:hypothetical protein B0H11DRAFT_1998689 [Mycena galericulata]|nr:hypothetical protein B0H11DRAFT_1998689 [Mycena galericulata]
MTSRCSECGAITIIKAEGLDVYITAPLATLARHSKLMNTNEPPDSPEQAYIRNIVSKTGPHLACLDEEISRLKGQLQQLEQERATLFDYDRQNTAILSPLRRIPPEVLREIFSWTLSSNLDEVINVKASPWVLTHINRRWRAVAISSASLWSLIYIDYSKECVYPLAMIEVQVQRARMLKIHFYGDQKEESSYQIEMFNFLSQHSGRWEDLSLGLTNDLVPHLTALRGRLSTLRRLWVQWDGSQSQIGVDSIKCFQTAYSLLDVGAFSEYRFVPTLLPLHNHITRYDFDAPWNKHAELLKSLPNLVEARIRVSFDDDPWPDPGETITLLCLWRLYVPQAQVLNYLTAPALREIVLYTSKENSLHVRHIEPFLIRSSCRLQRFCFKNLPDAHSMVEVLQKCSTLTEIALIIGGEDIDLEVANTVLAHLTVSPLPGSAVVLPQLSKLCFLWNRSAQINFPLYIRMLKSRWNTVDRALNVAEIITYSSLKLDPTTLGALDALKKDGLDLLVLSGSTALAMEKSWLYESQWN